MNEIIAAANAYTVKQHGPDRVVGFSPIPAMSMVSYAAGARYLSLIGGVCLSFYDWYCDLPPSSPQTWGEQTDVPESADWYNAGFLILWGSNVPQTRTPDAHFYTEARYRGAKSAVICPDYSEASKFGDIWLSVKQGTDAALAMAMGHVILKQFHVDKQVDYFVDYIKRYTDMPMLVKLVQQDGRLVPDRFLRASDLDGALNETNNAEWKTLAFDRNSGELVAPNGSVGFRWGEKGKWNLEEKSSDGSPVDLLLTLKDRAHDLVDVAFPYFGNIAHEHFASSDHASILPRRIPAARLTLKDGEALVASVYDLFLANYGVDRGFGGENVARDFDDNAPYSPAWAEAITGVSRDKIIQVAHEFALNAEKTKGRSMVIIGAGDEPLVPLRHELSRRHQHAGDVRLRRPVGRRLGALCRPGKAAPAGRLGAAGLRAGLGPPAPPAERHLLLLRAHRSMALRDAGPEGNPVADRARRAVGWRGDRLQRARRAHGLAALRAATRTEPADHLGQSRRKRPRPARLRRAGTGLGRVETLLQRPGRSEKLAAQHVCLALQPARLVGQGP